MCWCWYSESNSGSLKYDWSWSHVGAAMVKPWGSGPPSADSNSRNTDLSRMSFRCDLRTNKRNTAAVYNIAATIPQRFNDKCPGWETFVFFFNGKPGTVFLPQIYKTRVAYKRKIKMTANNAHNRRQRSGEMISRKHDWRAHLKFDLRSCEVRLRSRIVSLSKGKQSFRDGHLK